jgi:hypothetical protein
MLRRAIRCCDRSGDTGVPHGEGTSADRRPLGQRQSRSTSIEATQRRFLTSNVDILRSRVRDDAETASAYGPLGTPDPSRARDERSTCDNDELDEASGRHPTAALLCRLPRWEDDRPGDCARCGVRADPVGRGHRDPRAGRRPGPDHEHDQCHEHGVGAGGRIPGVLHAGRVHDAGGRLRPHAGGGQRPPGVHRRHMPLRPALLGVRVRVHVRRRQRHHRPPVLLSERGRSYVYLQRNVRHGCRVHGVLPVPVRVRRHLLDDHVGRDGRPYGVQGRPALQHLRERVHLPDPRSLGVGSGWLAPDGTRWGLDP